MLPARHRLRRSADFAHVIRGSGRRRAGGPAFVIHLATSSQRTGEPARAGFVVSKAVGNAVVRNTVKRRLRALLATKITDLPYGSDVVVRALPPAATASFAELAAQLDRQLARVVAQDGRVAPMTEGSLV